MLDEVDPLLMGQPGHNRDKWHISRAEVQAAPQLSFGCLLTLLEVLVVVSPAYAQASLPGLRLNMLKPSPFLPHHVLLI